MPTSALFRKVADFLDEYPQETAPFVVVASENLVSFGGARATVDEVDNLLTSFGVGGVWERHTSTGMWWMSTDHTALGAVQIYAPACVLDTVINALPKAWVAS